MIVVDANLIAYLFIPGDRTDTAMAVVQTDAEWIAPRLWRSEFRNVVELYTRKGELPLTDAISIMEEVEGLMDGNEFDVESRLVLNLASNSGCSAYDCEYVALALDLGVPLVTSDEMLLKKFPAVAVSIEFFISRT